MNASVSWISVIVLLQITTQNVLHCGNVQVVNIVSVLFDQLIKLSRCLYSFDLVHNFFFFNFTHELIPLHAANGIVVTELNCDAVLIFVLRRGQNRS